MTIIELLRTESARVSLGDRWLVVGEDGRFIVYERKAYGKTSRILIDTTDEAAAVRAMTAEEEA